MTKEQKQELFSSVCKRLNPSPWQQRVMWDVIDEIEAKVSNNWHTGLPTEEGDYLVAFRMDDGSIEYGWCQWDNVAWDICCDYDTNDGTCTMEKWMKIAEG